MDEQEATIILGYLEGHDYCLVVDTQGRTLRHDTQDGDDHREDKAYTIQDAIIFCWEMNEGILNNCESRGNLGEGYLTQLERDREILSEIMVQCL